MYSNPAGLPTLRSSGLNSTHSDWDWGWGWGSGSKYPAVGRGEREGVNGVANGVESAGDTKGVDVGGEASAVANVSCDAVDRAERAESRDVLRAKRGGIRWPVMEGLRFVSLSLLRRELRRD